MLKALVFDFDGVIVDSEPLHYAAFMRILEPLGWTFEYSEYVEKYIGFDDRDFYRVLFEEHGEPLDEKRRRSLIKAKGQAFADIVRDGIAACPGAVELIETASKRMPLAISSGALRADIDLLLPAIGDGGLPKCFSAIVTADEVPQSKPDPRCYVVAAERLGVAPADCLAIEDTVTGLASARGAGMKTLAVATTYPVELLCDADRAIESLAGVTVEKLAEWF